MEKYLFSSQHLVNLIFLAGSPSVTLFLPSSQFRKFSNREYNNVLIPCVFALIESKTVIMYRRV
ncbi:hypothetical protein HZS_2808 [Henneguya salminicola]|nr:hypothetical protein HZS_2808 [Henneguya salminicola]